eukprot:2275769-Rhodomonas_salina.1
MKCACCSEERQMIEDDAGRGWKTVAAEEWEGRLPCFWWRGSPGAEETIDQTTETIAPTMTRRITSPHSILPRQHGWHYSAASSRMAKLHSHCKRKYNQPHSCCKCRGDCGRWNLICCITWVAWSTMYC